MTGCPALSVLERGITADLRDHIAQCVSCRLVTELLDERRRGIDARDHSDECARFEILLAARDEGTLGGAARALLEDHLRVCAECQAVAATLPPMSVLAASSALPAVSPDAYALGQEVARGGMGRILAATDLRIGREIAVKELLGRSPSLAARFEREARITARLQHPGIVPIYEIGRWPDGTPFYTMRMVDGRTLREAIRDRTTLDERLGLLPALIAAAEAVAFAHGKQIIHRDLTPNNILVGAHGDTVVIDWGLAKELGDVQDDAPTAAPYRDDLVPSHLTHAGAIIGTAAYMPPEQANGAAVDERADVYALGAILYHVLAGEPPYGAGGSDETLHQVQAGPPCPIIAIATGAPRDLISIVDKAMARDPSRRYASAAELADELRRFQTGRLVEAHHYSRVERSRRWLRRHRGIAIGASVALVVLAVTGTIAIAGIVRERDRAEAGEKSAERVRAETARMAAELLEEQGRLEMLVGAPLHAAAWLSAAYSDGDDRPSLRFLLAGAMRAIEARQYAFDCGSPVTHITVGRDATLALATCSDALAILRIADGTLVRRLAGPRVGLEHAALAHTSRQVISLTGAGAVQVWNLDTGALAHTFPTDANVANAILTSDDARIITWTRDGTLRVWEMTTGKALRTIEAAAPGWLVEAGLIDDHVAWVAARDGGVVLWSLDTGGRVRAFDTDGGIVNGVDVDTSHGHRHALLCSLDGSAKLWDLDTGSLLRAFTGHSDSLSRCILDGAHHRVLTASADHTVKVWDANTGRLIANLIHSGIVAQMQLSADGARVVTAEPSFGVTAEPTGGVHVWDVATGTLLGGDDLAGGDSAEVLQLAGDRILTARDHEVWAWNGLASARARVSHVPAGWSVRRASNDGKRALIVASDGAVALWDVDGERMIPHEPLHEPAAMAGDLVAAVAGTGVAIVGADGRTRTRLANIDRPGALELGADGRFLLVRRDGGTTQAWDVASGAVIATWPRDIAVTGLETGRDVVTAIIKQPSGSSSRVEVWSLSPPHVVHQLFAATNAEHSSVDFDASRDQLLLFDGPETPSAAARIYELSNGREIRALSHVQALGRASAGTLVATYHTPDLEVVAASDGKTLAKLPWGMVMGGIDVTSDGAFVAASEIMTAKAELIDTSGRTLVELPFPNVPTIGDHSYQLAGRGMAISADGSRWVSYGMHDLVVVDLSREHRSAAEIERLVHARIPFRVQEGRVAFAPSARARVHGTITRLGAPAPGATVTLYDRNRVPITNATSGPDGTYELGQMEAGQVVVGAVAARNDAFARPTPITIAGGDNQRDIELDLAGRIAGTLVDDTGAPLAGIHVHAECADCLEPDGGDGGTDADGSFEVVGLMGGGAYVLHALVDGNGGRELVATPGQIPIRVADGKSRVACVRFIVKR